MEGAAVGFPVFLRPGDMVLTLFQKRLKRLLGLIFGCAFLPASGSVSWANGFEFAGRGHGLKRFACAFLRGGLSGALHHVREGTGFLHDEE